MFGESVSFIRVDSNSLLVYTRLPPPTRSSIFIAVTPRRLSHDVVRCKWVNLGSPLYVSYHDSEWGIPVFDDRKLFECLTLEGAQAGLSWETVLHKREGYRRAFADFDVSVVARYDESTVEELMLDRSIIRNRLKIVSAVANARAFIRVQEEYGSFSLFVWNFVGGKPIINAPLSSQDVPATSSISEEMSRVLKKRGFKFVGPTICYAFMQAAGMVNDHTRDCFRCPIR